MSSNVRAKNRPDCGRRGAVAVLVALLLVPLFAFVAFCVDMGWIAVTRSELQNAADASAAAGARQLSDNYAAYSISSQPQKAKLSNDAQESARTFALRYGLFNEAGGVKSLQILPDDVTFGVTDAAGRFQPLTGTAQYPNTIQVVVRRDGSANGKLPLFFAPVIGKHDHAMTATASATIYTGVINAFNPKTRRSGSSSSSAAAGNRSGSSSNGNSNGSASSSKNKNSSSNKSGSGLAVSGSGSGAGNGSGSGWADDWDASGAGGCLLLPVAFDVDHWNQFLATGRSPDQRVYLNANGSPEIQIYPSPQTAPGNVGLLCIGEWSNNAPTYREWILNGPSDADLQYLVDHGCFPVSRNAPKPWKGTPGLKSTLVSEFAAIQWEPRLLPLFKAKDSSVKNYQAVSGSGSNATYAIVGFVGVTISRATGQGNNMVIAVQPTCVMDASAVFDEATLYPAGTEPSTQLKTFTHAIPRFTR